MRLRIAHDDLPSRLVDTRRLYDGLAGIYLPIAAAVFATFLLVVVVAVVHYRRRDDRLPAQKHETRWEYAYAAVLACVAAFLVAATFRVEDKIDPTPVAARGAGIPALRVDVTAAQWNWRFSYPGLGVAVPPGPAATLVVPTRTRIVFRGTSEDVTHAFYVPERRFKRQLYQGSSTAWDLTWPRPERDIEGECTFYCGLEHSSMRFTVDAVPRREFAAWVRRQQARVAG